MQPIEARKGVPAKSQLFNSLKVYLNSSNRLQPIIGLGSIIECVNVGTHDREILYLCEVCVCRLSKADIRNHIMGSLHRYNYIKTWHSHLVSEWKEDADLSKLAWPLMEKARIIEGKEGPGDVQLLEFEDAVYQRMATCSENDAIILINLLRDEQGEHGSHSETTSVQLEHSPDQSHRIVLLARNQPGWSEKCFRTSAETNGRHSLTQSTVAPSVKSDGWLSYTSVQMSTKTSVLSENSSSFLDGYTGTKPLIGLHRVVECRSEDGHTYCLLCHCCRIRANKKDIIDHLTSSSHLKNYLMETHPEQVEVMMTDINDKDQLLQSLAKKVEQENGRGELKVVKAQESLCLRLTGKSYHWCLKMLCNGYKHTDNQKRKIGVKGPNVNKTSNQGMAEKCASRIRRRKKRKKSNTEFKVSLPLREGSMLLKRTSFSVDSIPVSPEHSLPVDCDLIPSPESPSEDCDLNCDTGSFVVNHRDHTSKCTTSQLQQDLYSGDADAGQSVVCNQVDGYFSDKEYPSEYTTVTKDARSYGERNDNTQHASQEGSSKRFYKEWQNENPQTQNEWLSSTLSCTQDCSSCMSSYRQLETCTEQWYNSTSQCEAGTREGVSREERWGMSSDGVWSYYQQQPQYPYTSQYHASPLTGSVGQHASAQFVLAPHFSASWMYMHAHIDNSVPGPGVQLQQTHMGVSVGQTATQSYMPQPDTQQGIQEGPWGMSNHKSNIEPTTNQQ